MFAPLFALSLSCGDDGGNGNMDAGPPGPEPDFPESYATTYTEVRDCRRSGDHDLNYIKVLTSSAATRPYQMRDRPFPVDSVVLKEEYDFGDPDCAGDIKQWTVMTRLADGTSAQTLDWRWQKVDAERNVVTTDEPRCYGCHTVCGMESEGGYDATCAHP